MFTYICLGTNNIARASVLYDAVLGTLGLSRCDVSGEPNWEDWVGWGTYEDNGITEAKTLASRVGNAHRPYVVEGIRT